jgi:hypothetical protein
MSDEQLRALERRWRTSGALDDEVEWVAALVRAGRVTTADLELAANVGSLAAQRLLPAARRWPRDAQAMAASLGEAARAVHVRAVAAMARRALDEWSRLHPEDDRPARAVEAAERWRGAPDDVERARAAIDPARAAAELETPFQGGETPAGYAARLCSVAAWFAFHGPRVDVARALSSAAWQAQCALTEEHGGRFEARFAAAGERVALALREALVPWLRA